MMNAIRHDETPNFYFMHYPPTLKLRWAGELATWRVKNLLLVPSFAFPPSAIIKRPPLAPTTRRAGWIGCNIALNRVPAEARIRVVTTILSPSPPSGDLSGLGNSERNLGEAKGPRGPSERARVSHWAGARWRESNPRSLSLSPLGRGEGMFEQVVISPAAEVREKFKRVKPLKEISVTQRGWTVAAFGRKPPSWSFWTYLRRSAETPLRPPPRQDGVHDRRRLRLHPRTGNAPS